MSDVVSEPTSAKELVARFRRWLAWGIAVAALLYVAFSVWVGIDSVRDALVRFSWLYYVPAIVLTLLNYALRFWKWHYLIRRLDVQIPAKDNAVIFGSGLAMVLSPGKVGELLKPYLLKERTGVAMTQTIPALVTERLTDGIAVLVLAAISVSTYAGDKAQYVFVPIALTGAGLAVLSSESLSYGILRPMTRLPGVLGKVGHTLNGMYAAMRVCVAPVPLILTVLVSIVAWGGECIGYWLVLKGFGATPTLGVSTFLYAFATVTGGASPGGLGVADGVLVELPKTLVAGLDPGSALASALLIRLATLWLGVVIGAVALVGVGDVSRKSG
jgi:uncharacterized protein (TIRG00374 family)